LPPESFYECLNFICSYSGNTEETIASFEEALENNLPCVALSSGGKIEEMAKEHHVPHILLPIPYENFQPRIGTGYFFGAMFQVLVNQGLVADVTKTLIKESLALKQCMGTLEEQGKLLAKKIAGKTPVIYSTARYKSVAMVWKIKFNENAKTPAFWNFFPELNHNEMVGWTLPQGKFIILMLRDLDTHQRVKKRFEITAQLLRENKVDVEILDIHGKSVYTKVFTSILLGDFVSYHLALAYGQDPTPVDMVEKLKKLLK
jgi:glucose/mannose-6-phosphate isomerase